jgi:hypothetical protein
MRFSGEHELHLIFLIGKKFRQSLVIVQQEIRSLVGGEPPCRAQSQRIRIKDRFGLFDFLMRCAISGYLPVRSETDETDAVLAGSFPRYVSSSPPRGLPPGRIPMPHLAYYFGNRPRR